MLVRPAWTFLPDPWLPGCVFLASHRLVRRAMLPPCSPGSAPNDCHTLAQALWAVRHQQIISNCTGIQASTQTAGLRA